MENQFPPEWRNKVMHIRMNIGTGVLMGSDGPGGRYQVPQGFAVSLNLKDAAEADRVYAAVFGRRPNSNGNSANLLGETVRHVYG